MSLDSNTIIAIATSVYGAATLLLVFQLWRDRVQRENHFRANNDAQKLNELRSAFYEAWGYWEAYWRTVGSRSVTIDSSQVGRQFEALARLECQLRLNGYAAAANNLGFAIRTNLSDIHGELGAAGLTLGLFPAEYRRAQVAGL